MSGRYIPSFIFSMSDGLIVAITPLYAADLSAGNLALVGLVSSAGSIGKLSADVPAGYAFSTYGVKKTMSLGLLGVVASGLASAAASHVSHLVLAAFLFGFSEAFFTVSRTAYIKTVIDPQFRGRAISIVGAINRMTRAIGPAIGGFMSHHVGVRVVYLTQACLPPFALLLITANMPDFKPSSASKKHSHNVLEPVLWCSFSRCCVSPACSALFLTATTWPA